MQKRQAISYLRVSTQNQKDAKTIEMQRDQVKAFADRKGFQIVEEFVDEAVSGATDVSEREGLTSLLSFLKDSTAVKDVLVYDQSRIARDVYIGLKAEKMAKDYDAVFHYVQAPTTGDEAVDTLLSTMLKGISQFERANITKRTQNGRLSAARQGKIILGGGVPVGYDYVDRSLIINEEEARIVKKMYELYLEPEGSTTTVTEWLVDNNIKTKTGKSYKGNTNTVRRILKKELYKGDYYYNKTKRKKIDGKYKAFPRPREEWVHIPVPPIVSEETWQAVQDKMDNAQTQSKKMKQNFYIFSGLIKCGICGRTFHARPTSYRKEGKQYYFYHCGSWNAVGIDRCENRSMSELKLVKHVWGYIKDNMLDPEYYRQGIEELTNISGGAKSAARAKINRYEKDLEKYAKREERLLEERIKGYFSPELTEKKLIEIQENTREIKEKLSKVKKNLIQLEKAERADAELEELLKGIADDIAQEIEDIKVPEPKVIRKYVKEFIDTIEIYPDKIILNGEINVEMIEPAWWGEYNHLAGQPQVFSIPIYATLAV